MPGSDVTTDGATAAEGVAEGTSAPPADDVAAMEAEIVAVGATMAGARARLLALVGEADASGAWAASGRVSCAHWLADLLDIEVCTAREHVRVARALRHLPETRAALDEGAMSYAKVRHLTRVAEPSTEVALLDLARDQPAGQLPTLLAAWQQRNDPEAAERRRREERSVTFRRDPTGLGVAVMRVPPEVADLLQALLDEVVLRRALDTRAGASADAPDASSRRRERRPTLAQQRADALPVLLAQLGHASADAFADRVVHPEIVYHRRVGELQLFDGTPLPDAVARHISCDADIRIMTHQADGSPADVGRRFRFVTKRLRRLVMERDQCCRFPGCRSRHFLDVHHVIHWEDGGPTALHNLVLLCDHHHAWVHERGWPPDAPPIVLAALQAPPPISQAA